MCFGTVSASRREESDVSAIGQQRPGPEQRGGFCALRLPAAVWLVRWSPGQQFLLCISSYTFKPLYL